jgi:glycosidase
VTYIEPRRARAGRVDVPAGHPCIHYGTEQGLHGAGDAPEAVREALWGKADAFDLSASAIRVLLALRAAEPAASDSVVVTEVDGSIGNGPGADHRRRLTRGALFT